MYVCIYNFSHLKYLIWSKSLMIIAVFEIRWSRLSGTYVIYYYYYITTIIVLNVYYFNYQIIKNT